MKILETDFVQNFIRMSADGWKQGWHECHSGNLSYRVKPEEIESVKNDISYQREWMSLDIRVPQLAHEFFLITGSGKFFKNIPINPQDSLGLIELDATGSNYRVIWGLINGGKPTSELSTHLMSHQVKKQILGEKYRVVYHAHPGNIIALSFLLPLDNIIFTRKLWEMEPECAMTFPKGIGILPWRIPGTIEIAQETCIMMKEYDAVLWAQHGLFTAKDTFDNSFGLMHTIEKASEILLKVLSVKSVKQQVPSSKDFKKMAKYFDLDLPEKFLL